MIADTAKLSTKGQVVLPKKIRDQLDLEPGDELFVTLESEEEGKISIRRLTLEDMIAEAERELETGQTVSHDEVFDDG